MILWTVQKLTRIQFKGSFALSLMIIALSDLKQTLGNLLPILISASSFFFERQMWNSGAIIAQISFIFVECAIL